MTNSPRTKALGQIWAGWRKEYVARTPDTAEKNTDRSTVFEKIFATNSEPNKDNYVLWQGSYCAAVLNLYPYVSGHVLVLPKRKVGDLANLDKEEYLELWEGVRLATQAIQSAYKPDGINIGVNIGEAAGASIPEHLHVHCLPRWKGDTTFLTSVAESRMIPETLSSTWDRLQANWPHEPL